MTIGGWVHLLVAGSEPRAQLSPLAFGEITVLGQLTPTPELAMTSADTLWISEPSSCNLGKANKS